MSQFESSNVNELINAAKDVWEACVKSNLEALETPSNYPEFTFLQEKFIQVKFEDFFSNPVFKAKLFVTNEAEYCDVYKDDHIHIMAIFMPPKMVYPIHDHPGMLVFSKVLKGHTIMKHYDILEKDKFYANIAKLNFSKLVAKKSHVNVLKENQFDCVLPNKGNLHSIESVHRTIILDVMFNYYDDCERPCSFFTLGQQKGDNLFELFFYRDDN